MQRPFDGIIPPLVTPCEIGMSWTQPASNG